jgi:hypothetical protein
MPRLKSGVHIDTRGYICFSAGPLRGKRLHRHLMEEHLGRPLLREEHVHHRDGDKLNNGLNGDGRWNLELMNANEHNAVSARQLWYLKKYVWPREELEMAEALDAVEPGMGDVSFETRGM